MRKNKKQSALKALSYGVLGFTAAYSARAETQITFGSFTLNNEAFPAGYGSNVSSSSADYTVSPGATGITGTPDLTAAWGPGFQTYIGWDGRGEVAQLDFGNVDPDTITFTLTPSSGFAVLVRSFDLDNWAGGGDADVSWIVSDSVGTLASGTWTQPDAGGRTTINTGLGVGDVRPGEAVTVTFTLNTGSPSYIALDNLTFDQVPEPSTTALALTGLALGAMAMRRRHRK
ncbi:MAG TPA: PEP-CTERM sorting domain-containing protein [Verrucomicrobiae bacterium]